VACGLRDGGGWLELVEHDRCGLGLDGFLFMVHVLRFGSGADHRLDGPGRGTVMRHFSFAEPSSVLQLAGHDDGRPRSFVGSDVLPPPGFAVSPPGRTPSRSTGFREFVRSTVDQATGIRGASVLRSVARVG